MICLEAGNKAAAVPEKRWVVVFEDHRVFFVWGNDGFPDRYEAAALARVAYAAETGGVAGRVVSVKLVEK